MSRMLNSCPPKLEQFNAVQELNQQITSHSGYIDDIKETIATLQVPVHQNCKFCLSHNIKSVHTLQFLAINYYRLEKRQHKATTCSSHN